MKKLLIAVISLLLIVAGLYSLRKENNFKRHNANFISSEVAVAWFELQTNLVRGSNNYTPPSVARVFGYSGVTLYEAVLPGSEGNSSLFEILGFTEVVPKFDSTKEYNWEIVANEALSEITKEMFPSVGIEKVRKISELKTAIEEKHSDVSPEVYAASKAWGKEVAQAIFEFSKDDGGHMAFLDNFPEKFDSVNGEGAWVATAPNYLSALLPYWGDNRYFVAASDEGCILAPHPEFSTNVDSEFYKEAYEVYETTNTLTKEENEIAVFWADDSGETSTPPGHWISILNGILEKDEYSLFESAEIYAKLGIVLSDSFISAWKEKYDYNLIRPITYIQKYIDPAWDTPEIIDQVVTPPFPEYPSGHSVQSGAAATVLTDYFGENFSFVDFTHFDKPRVFNSFMEAADEAAISRLYGGIHFRSAIDNGIDLGVCIGEKVNNIKLK